MDEENNVKVVAIKHGKSRLATFKKRRNNLLKKAREFTILCGVQLCCIIYGPKLKDVPARPETWPPEEGQLMNIINRYKEIVGGGDNHQAHRDSSSSSFHENSDDKIDEEVSKTGRIEGNKKFFTWDPCFDDFSEDQLRSILGRVVVKLTVARKTIKRKKGANVVKRDGSKQEYLKNNKEKAPISKKSSAFNNNDSHFGGVCDSMATIQYGSLHTDTSLRIGPSSSDQRHRMPENMVINNSNPQMQIVSRLNNDESNMYAGQVNVSSNVSKSPQKEQE